MRSAPSCADAWAQSSKTIAKRKRRSRFTARRYNNPLSRLEPEALDAIHVHALEPDELGRPFALRRVQVAFVVDVRHARHEPVCAQRSRLARLALARRLD